MRNHIKISGKAVINKLNKIEIYENAEFNILKLLRRVVCVWIGCDMLYAFMMVAESPIAMHIYFRYSYTDLAVTLARVISLQNDISRIICCANYHIFSFSATPFVCSIVTRFQVS